MILILLRFKILFFYFSVINLKNSFKKVQRFLGFCISAIPNLHNQGRRVYITFTDIWIRETGGRTNGGNRRKREILTSVKMATHYQLTQAVPVLLGMKHDLRNEIKEA